MIKMEPALPKRYEYLNSVVKEDPDFITHVLLTCMSAYTDNSQSLGVLAATSEGKTYGVMRVVELFPKKDVWIFAGASPKSLFYQEGARVTDDGTDVTPAIAELEGQRTFLKALERDYKRKLAAARTTDEEKLRVEQELNGNAKQQLEVAKSIGELKGRSYTRVSLGNKVLVFLEPLEFELWKAMKPLLSHDAKESFYFTVEKEDKVIRTHKILLMGWPTLIFCSANSKQDQWSIWPEIESRCNIISPSTSQEKYLAANKLTANLRGLPKFMLEKVHPTQLFRDAADDVSSLLSDMKTLFGDNRDSVVLNPFRNWLAEAYPHTSGKHMRGFDHFLAYVNMHTVESWKDRPKLTDTTTGGIKGIITVFQDIEHVLALVGRGDTLSLSPEKWTFHQKVVLPAWVEVLSLKNPGEELTVEKITQVAKRENYNVGGNRLRKRYLEPLENVGLIISHKSPDDRRANVYTVDSERSGKYGGLSISREFALEELKAAWNEVEKYGRQEGFKEGDAVIVLQNQHGVPISDIKEFALSIGLKAAFLEQSSGSSQPEQPKNAAEEQSAASGVSSPDDSGQEGGEPTNDNLVS